MLNQEDLDKVYEILNKNKNALKNSLNETTPEKDTTLTGDPPIKEAQSTKRKKLVSNANNK